MTRDFEIEKDVKISIPYLVELLKLQVREYEETHLLNHKLSMSEKYKIHKRLFHHNPSFEDEDNFTFVYLYELRNPYQLLGIWKSVSWNEIDGARNLFVNEISSKVEELLQTLENEKEN